MSLQKQGAEAYKNQVRQSKINVSKEKTPPTGGLMNRNKEVNNTDKLNDPNDKSAYLMEQFKFLQKKRMELNNG